MTSMLMGADYGSAALFWTRVTAGRRWHAVGLGFLPTTAVVANAAHRPHRCRVRHAARALPGS